MIMESFVCHPFSTYHSFRGNLTPSRGGDFLAKQPSWKQSNSSSISPFFGGPRTPRPSDYLESYRRSQLQGLLSQMSPGLPPRLCRASTKEVGVQVSLRADAAVQCSLGPRTLPLGRPLSPAALRTQGHLALYSPLPDRRLFMLPDPTEAQKDVTFKMTPKEQKAEKRSGEPDVQTDAAVPSEETVGKGQEEAAIPQRRTPFQFLEQKYGYFHCKDCKTRWESAYVWCISGSNKVYFKQLCRKCQKSFNPYRVESIQCQTCSRTRCSCPQKKRHIDFRRPHRQELCGRCKDKRLSCDNAYSFKYIV